MQQAGLFQLINTDTLGEEGVKVAKDDSVLELLCWLVCG